MGWDWRASSARRARRALPPNRPRRDWRRRCAAAERVAKRFGVEVRRRRLHPASRREDDQRTLYLLDVRTREEFERGHVAGSRHAPGGQLVQASDEYVGVRNARVVLVDPERCAR